MGARNSGRGQLRPGGRCQAAGDGVPEAGTETKACQAGGDGRTAAASPAAGEALDPLHSHLCLLSSLCSASPRALPPRICPTLRTPLRGKGRQIGPAPFCLGCLFLHPACILSDIIDGRASEGRSLHLEQSWGRPGKTVCAQQPGNRGIGCFVAGRVVSSLSPGAFKQGPAVLGWGTRCGVISVCPELDPPYCTQGSGVEVPPPAQDGGRPVATRESADRGL